ncbi:MAG: S-adenosyl-l-methionine hydroxide adenosyltransferase [Calditrichaeota bacterium]|nr:MAG: S-adenosyl-l-methionine hydroxide adenosyltransferase [Calditrichota bacterium]
MKKNNSIVTLLTDFGTEDGYVGAIKGILQGSDQDMTIIDITHNIEPYNIRQVAFSLINYAFYFPPGTIHLAVVDPGVGSNRECLILQTDDYYFVGPNNGVFSYILRETSYEAFQIKEESFGSRVSSTFHGRDIFAPAIVRIIQGDKLSDFTRKIDHLTSFYEYFEDMGDDEYRLKVIHVDHFGNLVVNFTISDWKSLGSPSNIRAQINHSFIYGIKRTFSDVEWNQLLLTWDSRGFLQIAQNGGNAARLLNMKAGDHIILRASHT